MANSPLAILTEGTVKRFWVEMEDGEKVLVEKGLLIGADEEHGELHLAHLKTGPHEGLQMLTIATRETGNFVRNLTRPN